jgi:16S rRNA (guanine1207-N2)-methyltransferase
LDEADDDSLNGSSENLGFGICVEREIVKQRPALDGGAVVSEHYYTSNPGSEHDRREWTATLRGKTFQFVTDAGVFSRHGVDFGSALLIRHMEVAEDAAVLDVGCGYGPIGLTAAYLASRGHVTMLDVNERAVELARENAKRNGLANVTVLQSDRLAALSAEERFDCILTNPPIRAGKATVYAIFEESERHLKPGGSLWVVIQKKQGAPSAYAKLESLFGSVEETAKDKGYRIFKAVKQ